MSLTINNIKFESNFTGNHEVPEIEMNDVNLLMLSKLLSGGGLSYPKIPCSTKLFYGIIKLLKALAVDVTGDILIAFDVKIPTHCSVDAYYFGALLILPDNRDLIRIMFYHNVYKYLSEARDLLKFSNEDYDKILKILTTTTEASLPALRINIPHKVLRLNRAYRLKAENVFLLNPFTYEYHDFTYHPSGKEVLSSVPFQAAAKPELGSRSIVAAAEDAKLRLAELSMNIFDDSFDWTNVVIAGGSVCCALEEPFNKEIASLTDIDLFVHGATREIRTAAAINLLKWFETKTKVYTSVVGSVVNIYIPGLKRKFQIISAGDINRYSVIHRFDTTNIMWLYDGTNFYGTRASFAAVSTRDAELVNVGTIKNERLIKCLYKGYNLIVNKELDVDDFTSLYKNSDECRKVIRRMYGAYYPEAADSEMRILASIERDSGSQAVNLGTAAAGKLMVHDGEFHTGYNAIAAECVSFDTIEVPVNRRNTDRMIKTDRKTILIVSAGSCEIMNTQEQAAGYEVTFKALDEKFRAFVNDVLYTKIATKFFEHVRGDRVDLDNFKFCLQTDEPFIKRTCKTTDGGSFHPEALKVGDKVDLLISFKTLHADKTIEFILSKIISRNDEEVDDNKIVTPDKNEKNVKLNYVDLD